MKPLSSALSFRKGTKTGTGTGSQSGQLDLLTSTCSSPLIERPALHLHSPSILPSFFHRFCPCFRKMAITSVLSRALALGLLFVGMLAFGGQAISHQLGQGGIAADTAGHPPASIDDHIAGDAIDAHAVDGATIINAHPSRSLQKRMGLFLRNIHDSYRRDYGKKMGECGRTCRSEIAYTNSIDASPASSVASLRGSGSSSRSP